jgi:amidophosphoribosyltransferase
MSGMFGIVAKEDCVEDLFYGTDYQSHMGKSVGGMAVLNGDGTMPREIHDVSNNQFRFRFEDYARKTHGKKGIGVIGDYEPQPMILGSHLGTYALAHVGKIANLNDLVSNLRFERVGFTEMSKTVENPVEILSKYINKGDSFVEGIEIAQEKIGGSSSMMLLTNDGIIVARDKLGTTPISVGRKEDAIAATSEDCAFPTRGFRLEHYLGPGEIGIINENGYKMLRKPGERQETCLFLPIYYSNPASHIEGINVEIARYAFGAIHADKDIKEGIEVDYAAGTPDSGTAQGNGYTNRRRIPFKRPLIKYTETWQRSFMPQDQEVRNLTAQMKLIPIPELIEGQRILFTEDSIVRGTQLQRLIKALKKVYHAAEIHMRVASPPLTSLCTRLNFSRSKGRSDLAALRAIEDLGDKSRDISKYLDEDSEDYRKMVDKVRDNLGLDSLRYLRREEMMEALGTSPDKWCWGCWQG